MIIDVTFYDLLGFTVSMADTIGLLLSIIAAIVALLCFYELNRASKILGGMVGKAFRRIMVGIYLTVITIAFLVLTLGLLNQYEKVYVMVIGPVVWLIGNIAFLIGFRDIIKIKMSKS